MADSDKSKRQVRKTGIGTTVALEPYGDLARLRHGGTHAANARRTDSPHRMSEKRKAALLPPPPPRRTP